MRVYTKQTNFRCPRLLALAKECPCCMSCGAYNYGNIVAAHSNSQVMGKSMGNKAHDIPAMLCNSCHDIVDGREGGFSREFKELMWLRALAKTFVWLFNENHLQVK